MTPLESFRQKRAAEHVCEHGSLARKCGDCDAVESGLEAEAWQARALAAEAALAESEARGRAHGLLAAAMSAVALGDSLVTNGGASKATALWWHIVDLRRLAAEATDGQ